MMNLADPDLELIDPTPNVHSMFLHFDRTFFWVKLSSRCVVRWSKRMYSCAGTCSYEGRGGLCDIALSEPLLKLRPRKDLVETLLHEMIHAFLFVTNRDQDRDGHGPNFQAHMHRINRAAGLNISIYHDFHDEVKLYQTHWWRCNGPCQSQRPHFGIVRRTNNRAPGPSDYWWSNHQRNCGGMFIKIKEPDKPEKKGKNTNTAKPNADITKYINTNNNNNKETNNKNKVQNDKPKKPILKDSGNVLAPKVGIKTNSSSTLVVTKKNVIFSPQVPKAKVVVFNGTGQTIGAKQPSNGERKRTSSNDVLETVRNVWSNKQIDTNNIKRVSKDNNSTTASNRNKHKPDYQSESPPSKVKKIDDYFKTAATSVLKDLYGQDFDITQSKGDQKLKAIPTKSTTVDGPVDSKITQSKVDQKLTAISTKSNLVDCPVCSSKIDSNEINRHLDECLNKGVIEKLSKEGISLVKSEPNVNIKKVDNSQDNRGHSIIKSNVVVLETDIKNTDILKEKEDKLSSIINKRVTNTNTIDLTNLGIATDVNRKRSRTSFDQGDLRVNEQKKSVADNKNSKLRKSDSFKEPTTNILQTTPILTPTIKIEPSCSKTDETDTACPCCGDKLNKSVDEHLDECLSFFENNTTIPEEGASTSYGTIVIDDDDDDKFDESQIFNATGTKLPCPCCFKMIEEIDMNSHLDQCLS